MFATTALPLPAHRGRGGDLASEEAGKIRKEVLKHWKEKTLDEGDRKSVETGTIRMNNIQDRTDEGRGRPELPKSRQEKDITSGKGKSRACLFKHASV